MTTAATAALPDPDDYVAAVVRRSGTSFLLGMKLLPRERRQAMYAIYAFGREVDDVADEPGAVADKLRQLDDWRAEVDRLYAGCPQFPTTRALLGPVARFNLPRQEFLLLIDGMEMDAREAMRGPERPVLEAYCRRVAGTIGLLSLAVFGAAGPDATAFALALADALQLTNILRDVEEDAARGRLYLPADLLAHHGIDPAIEPARIMAEPGLTAVCRDLAAVARARFDAADAALLRCRRRTLLPALLMMGTYEAIWRRLAAEGFRPVPGGIRMTKREKLWAALRYGFFRPQCRPST